MNALNRKRSLRDIADELSSLPSANEVNRPRPKRDKRTARPRDYFRPFRSYLAKAVKAGRTTIEVVIYCRVSDDKQKYNDNISHQITAVRSKLAKLARLYGIQIKILGEFEDDGRPGWGFWKGGDKGRPGLLEAAKLARKNGAVLVALNTSRFIRNRDFHKNGAAPTVGDFEELLRYVGNGEMATLVHPNIHEDKSADTERGIQAKQAGHKKWRRQKYRPQVKELFRSGCSQRGIARELDLPESTVRRWCSKWKKCA